MAALLVVPGIAEAKNTEAMYRLYNQWSGEHLFTTNEDEYEKLAGLGWTQEGEVWQAPDTGTDVYRLYNPYSGDHFYTSDRAEYERLGTIGWWQEGTSFHSGGGVPIYRLFNQWLTAGTHLFTTDRAEYDRLGGLGWSGEDVAFYAMASGELPAEQSLQVVESGYSVDDSGYVHYGARIKNPNPNYLVKYSELVITGRDASGRIVFSNSRYVTSIRPGEEQYYGGFAGSGTAPTTVEFSIRRGNDTYDYSTESANSLYTISNTSEVIGQYGSVHYTGQIVQNQAYEDYDHAYVTLILRDKSGSIVYGDYSYVAMGKVGETSYFDLSEYDVPEHASYELHAVPTN